MFLLLIYRLPKYLISYGVWGARDHRGYEVAGNYINRYQVTTYSKLHNGLPAVFQLLNQDPRHPFNTIPEDRYRAPACLS